MGRLDSTVRGVDGLLSFGLRCTGIDFVCLWLRAPKALDWFPTFGADLGDKIEVLFRSMSVGSAVDTTVIGGSLVCIVNLLSNPIVCFCATGGCIFRWCLSGGSVASTRGC